MGFWQGKVAIITGGSSGLGKAFARTFALAGAKVIIAARTPQTLESVAESLRHRGQPVLAIRADVAQREDVAQLVQKTLQYGGRLDVLVNCVGRSERRAIVHTTPEDFLDLMECNLFTAVRCTRAATPHLIKTKGHIVNIGSLASHAAPAYLGAYPASKAALAAYSQQLRLELGPQGVHTLLICPGPIARGDTAHRYNHSPGQVPERALGPGGGTKLSLLQAKTIAQQALTACEKRCPELVLPRKARLLFAVSRLAPRFGDLLLKKFT